MKGTTLQSILIAILLMFSFQSVANAAHNGGSGGPENSKEQGSSHGQPFKTLQSHIDMLAEDLDAAVADLQQQIDDLVASQAAQDVIIASLQTAVSMLQDRVTANEGDIAALQAADIFLAQLIAALDVRLTDLEARVTANEGDIAAIILADQTTQMMITMIKDQLVVLSLRIDANDGDIVTLQSQVSSLQVQLNNLQTQLAAKQDRVNGVCPVGSSIRVINANGTVVCETDDVSAGVGTLAVLTVDANQTVPGAGILAGTLSLSATCPSTHRITGGGHQISGFTTGIGIISGDPRLVNLSRSRASGTGAWNAFVINDNIALLGNGLINLNVRAVCGRVQ